MTVHGSGGASAQLIVRDAASRYGSRPAFELGGVSQSFAQTYERALRLAGALESLGLGPGDRFGIMATNGPWFFESYVAACETGIVEMPINLRFTGDELVAYLTRLEPAVLLVTAAQATAARQLQERLPGIRHLVGIGERHGLPFDYEQMLATATATERPVRDPGEAVLICPTSGTSGDVKAVLHNQLATATGWHGIVERFEIGDDSHFVTGLPMYFATAYSGWTASFVAGARHSMLPGFDPRAYVDLVEAVAGTHAFLGPAPANMIMDTGVDPHRLRSLRYLSLGGAPAAPDRLLSLVEAFGRRLAVQFGMTELAVATALLGEGITDGRGELLPTATSVGRPLDGISVRLVSDNGDVLPHDGASPGEMQVSGPVVSMGYLGTDAPGPAGDRAWFATGDVATIDADGNVFIVDRKKDLIVSGGINVAPLEVERVIGLMPGVAAVGVCGVPDATYGEAVHAAVVLDEGATADESDIVAWCRDRLASVKKPRSVSFVEALPISSTGKLLRRELRRQLKSGT